MKKVAFVMNHNFSNIIKSIDYVNWLFKEKQENLIITPKLKNNIYDLIKDYLPKFEVKIDEVAYNLLKINKEKLKELYPDYEIHHLDIMMKIKSKEKEALIKKPFNWNKLKLEPTNNFANIEEKYFVFSADNLSKNRAINDLYMKTVEKKILKNNIKTVLIGNNSKEKYNYKPEQETLDLRGKTTFEDLIVLLKNCKQSLLPANALALLSYGLNTKTMVLGEMKFSQLYKNRFFPQEKENFELIYI